MAKVAIPQSEFKPHPMGQGSGTVYAVHSQPNVVTNYGMVDKVVIKIASDLPLEGDDGKPKLGDDDEPLYFTIWDWVNVSRTGKLKDRREQILGRALTTEELKSGEFETDDIIGTRVGFTVKHNPNMKEPGKVYSNIDALWRDKDQTANPAHAHLIDHTDGLEEDDPFAPKEDEEIAPPPTTPPPDASPPVDPPQDSAVARIDQGLLDTIGSLEAAAGFTPAMVLKQRMKYLGDDDLSEIKTPAAAEAYIERLNLFLGDDD